WRRYGGGMPSVAAAALPELPRHDDQRGQRDETRHRQQQRLLGLADHGRFPSAASATSFAMRADRVSGRRAVSTFVMPSLRDDGGNASHAARAAGDASSAAARSSGSRSASALSSIVQAPFAFATSIARMPASASSPSASSLATRALFVAAH